jgi:hypothetical protein
MTRVLTGLSVLGFSFLGAACGPSYESDIKTPDEILAEQEEIAAEDAKESEAHRASVDPEDTESEEKAKFDKKQSDLELKRAARGAESCPGSLPDDQKKTSPKGMAKVTLIFLNDGHVKSGTISPPFEDTPVGACVLRAMNNVIVPVFTGPEETIEWEIDLTGEKKADKPAEE